MGELLRPGLFPADHLCPADARAVAPRHVAAPGAAGMPDLRACRGLSHRLSAGGDRDLHARRRRRLLQRLPGDHVSTGYRLELSSVARSRTGVPGWLRTGCQPLRQLRLRRCSGYSTSYGGCSSYGCSSYGGCSSCGGCSAYHGCSSCGGCSPGGGCSSCGDGGCGLSGGCSSCGSGQPALPGPADMSQPSLSPAPVTIPGARRPSALRPRRRPCPPFPAKRRIPTSPAQMARPRSPQAPWRGNRHSVAFGHRLRGPSRDGDKPRRRAAADRKRALARQAAGRGASPRFQWPEAILPPPGRFSKPRTSSSSPRRRRGSRPG